MLPEVRRILHSYSYKVTIFQLTAEDAHSTHYVSELNQQEAYRALHKSASPKESMTEPRRFTQL